MKKRLEEAEFQDLTTLKALDFVMAYMLKPWDERSSAKSISDKWDKVCTKITQMLDDNIVGDFEASQYSLQSRSGTWQTSRTIPIRDSIPSNHRRVRSGLGPGYITEEPDALENDDLGPEPKLSHPKIPTWTKHEAQKWLELRNRNPKEAKVILEQFEGAYVALKNRDHVSQPPNSSFVIA